MEESEKESDQQEVKEGNEEGENFNGVFFV